MNIILIGMPGAGKSTIGPALASICGKDFIDTDQIIKEKEGRELKDIVNTSGYEEFLRIQEEIILALKVGNNVIATGGSVVLSDLSMQHFKQNGRIVYLKMEFDHIQNRLSPDRRLARSGEKSLFDVYAERTPLYEKYADYTADCTGKSVEDITKDILSDLASIGGKVNE